MARPGAHRFRLKDTSETGARKARSSPENKQRNRDSFEPFAPGVRRLKAMTTSKTLSFAGSAWRGSFTSKPVLYGTSGLFVARTYVRPPIATLTVFKYSPQLTSH
jgi:hypothetical protein